MLYLPPYSPNLNLIEWVWKFVKAGCSRTKYYDNFNAGVRRWFDDLPTKHKAAWALFSPTTSRPLRRCHSSPHEGWRLELQYCQLSLAMLLPSLLPRD